MSLLHLEYRRGGLDLLVAGPVGRPSDDPVGPPGQRLAQPEGDLVDLLTVTPPTVTEPSFLPFRVVRARVTSAVPAPGIGSVTLKEPSGRRPGRRGWPRPAATPADRPESARIPPRRSQRPRWRCRPASPSWYRSCRRGDLVEVLIWPRVIAVFWPSLNENSWVSAVMITVIVDWLRSGRP